MALYTTKELEAKGLVTLDTFLGLYDNIVDGTREVLWDLSHTDIIDPEDGMTWWYGASLKPTEDARAYVEDWECLMDYACLLHPEWADAEC